MHRQKGDRRKETNSFERVSSSVKREAECPPVPISKASAKFLKCDRYKKWGKSRTHWLYKPFSFFDTFKEPSTTLFCQMPERLIEIGC
jgi:hypothetical protein